MTQLEANKTKLLYNFTDQKLDRKEISLREAHVI